jgi:type II secretory pathway component PulK
MRRRCGGKRRHRGFVLTMAIMIMALVGVVLAALMTQAQTQARQVRQAREAAQVEALLLAGEKIAGQDGLNEGEHAIALPVELADSGAHLKISMKGEVRIIEAKAGTRISRERIDADGRIVPE